MGWVNGTENRKSLSLRSHIHPPHTPVATNRAYSAFTVLLSASRMDADFDEEEDVDIEGYDDEESTNQSYPKRESLGSQLQLESEQDSQDVTQFESILLQDLEHSESESDEEDDFPFGDGDDEEEEDIEEEEEQMNFSLGGEEESNDADNNNTVENLSGDDDDDDDEI